MTSPSNRTSIMSITTLYLVLILTAFWNFCLIYYNIIFTVCSWGPIANADPPSVVDMFKSSACSVQSDPVFTAMPPGPFCFVCSWEKRDERSWLSSFKEAAMNTSVYMLFVIQKKNGWIKKEFENGFVVVVVSDCYYWLVTV